MKALIIVDVQNDFCPGGSLSVKEGDAIVPHIIGVASDFDIVVTTQDWHPSNHSSFASNNPGTNPFDTTTIAGKKQTLWPDHCVQGTKGAELHPQLRVQSKTFKKGTNPQADSYSGFFDNDGVSTGLGEYLNSKGVTQAYVCGLSTDYCVKFTALDAIKQGYKVVLLADLCRAVNISPHDGQKAVEEIRIAGAEIMHGNQIK